MGSGRHITTTSSNPYIKSLVYGTAWQRGDTVTYHLAESDLNSNGQEDWSERGTGAAMHRAFASWSAVANIRFDEVATAADADITENVVAGDGGGAHYMPGDVAHGSGQGGTYGTLDLEAGFVKPGGTWYFIMVHEIGHAIGLNHPQDGPNFFPGMDANGGTGDHGLNQQIWTIMSYNYKSDNRPDLSPYFGGVVTPMAFDIAAAQWLYGANTTTATGNTAYRLPAANAVGSTYSCIWDAGGIDTVAAGAEAKAGATIDLRAATLHDAVGGGGYLSSVQGIAGGFTIAHGVVIENAKGTGFADTITGNNAANTLWGLDGSDVLSGGAGNDKLIGGSGADRLIGGSGADQFVFMLSADSAATASDTIADFAAGDTIDLRSFAAGLQIGFAENASGTVGVLTARSGADQLRIRLAGDFIASGFHTTASGAGTAVTYTSPAQANTLSLTAAHV